MPTNGRQHPSSARSGSTRKTANHLINHTAHAEKAKCGSCLLLECLLSLGNQLVRRRRSDDGGLLGTSTGAAIELAMIAPAMRTHLDFENSAVGRAGDLLQGLAAARQRCCSRGNTQFSSTAVRCSWLRRPCP